MKLNRNIVLFALAMAFLGCAGGIFETTSNNYYAETFNITAEQRGDLELPREFPGFMVAAMAGALFFATEAALGIAAACMVSLGMVGRGVCRRLQPPRPKSTGRRTSVLKTFRQPCRLRPGRVAVTAQKFLKGGRL